MRFLLILITFFVGGEALKADSSSFRIAAVVNNNIISQSDLMNRLRFATISSGLESTPENLEKMKPQMLRIMIDEQLQLQVGKLYDIEIDHEYIQAAISDIEESNALAPGTISKMMQENNIPSKTLEDQIRAQLTWLFFIQGKYPLKTFEDQIGNKRNQGFSPSLQVTDREIDQEIQFQKEKETKKQYHFAEILLVFDRPDQETEIQNNITQLLEELQKGAPFSALAQQFSQSATSSQGGDMGWLTEDQMEPEVKEIVSQMQPGQLSSPIRTSQGYVIIAFIEQKLPSAEGHTLLTVQQVLVPFPSDITEEKAQEMMEKTAEIVNTAANCSVIEKKVKETFPLAAFHLIQAEPLSHFPGALQNILNSLELNQASKPLLTPEGVLVVRICEKQAQQAQELSREEAIERIAARKHSLLARRELRDLRHQAFINIR